MPNLNKVMLMGHLTRDPELRYLPSGSAVAGFGLAINRRWKNQQGEAQEEVTFVVCETFGKTAEAMNKYLRKGKPVFVEGRLKLDQWQDREGNKRSKLKVIVERFEFIDTRGSGDGQPQDAVGKAMDQSPPSPPADPHQPPQQDDIPF